LARGKLRSCTDRHRHQKCVVYDGFKSKNGRRLSLHKIAWGCSGAGSPHGSPFFTKLHLQPSQEEVHVRGEGLWKYERNLQKVRKTKSKLISVSSGDSCGVAPHASPVLRQRRGGTTRGYAHTQGQDAEDGLSHATFRSGQSHQIVSLPQGNVKVLASESFSNALALYCLPGKCSLRGWQPGSVLGTCLNGCQYDRLTEVPTVYGEGGLP